MGDSGDYWNDHRDYERRQRDKMVECEGCQRLTFPDSKCVRCGEENETRKPTKLDAGPATWPFAKKQRE